LQTAIAGRAFRLFADVAGGQPLSYQWKINGTNIAGATNAVLRFGRLELTNSGVYTLAVTNAQGSLTSTGATLTVSRAPVCPASPDIAYFVQADGVIKAMAAQTNTGKIVIAGPLQTYQWTNSEPRCPAQFRCLDCRCGLEQRRV
jgi:hypothetical protein